VEKEIKETVTGLAEWFKHEALVHTTEPPKKRQKETVTNGYL
jgi:hypothetical protein